jgi:hypothetical protein
MDIVNLAFEYLLKPLYFPSKKTQKNCLKKKAFNLILTPDFSKFANPVILHLITGFSIKYER